MEQGVEMWLDQMDCVEQFLLAGLAREARNDDELREKYADGISARWKNMIAP